MELGYKGDDIAYKKEKIETGDHPDVALAWLIRFENTEIANYQKAYNAVPETVWSLYKATNTKGMYEQKKLKEAKDNLISMWKSRPSILRRDKIANTGTKNQCSGKGHTGPRRK